MIKGKYPPTPENPRIWPFCGGGGAVLIGTLTGSGSCMALSGGTWVWRDYVGAAGLLFSGNGFLVKSRWEMFMLAAHAPLVLFLRGENKGMVPWTTKGSTWTTKEKCDMEFRLIRRFIFKKRLFFAPKTRIFLEKVSFLRLNRPDLISIFTYFDGFLRLTRFF